jgi:hypothetical protein
LLISQEKQIQAKNEDNDGTKEDNDGTNEDNDGTILNTVQMIESSMLYLY